MVYNVNSVEEYIAALPEDRRDVIIKLRSIIGSNLPDGFTEEFNNGWIGYVVPLSIYPKGYHVKKGEPLLFLALAYQKNYIALYHMGLYGNESLTAWFAGEYAKRVKTKLDMGKSCIRFKRADQIPYDLIAELCTKMTVNEFINYYETVLKN